MKIEMKTIKQLINIWEPNQKFIIEGIPCSGRKLSKYHTLEYLIRACESGDIFWIS